MQNRLSESNTALERFAYSASHDLQEPLRKISAFSGALERRICKVTDDEEMLMLLNRVSDASVRMSEMVDNLLELSRATRSPLSISNVSLSSIIAQSLDDLSTKLSGTNASVSLKKDGFIDIDPNAFTQVLRNLLSNSIKYRDSTRPLVIEIDFAKTAGAYHITVSDNGTGIPENKGEQIFEPFQRLVGRDNPGTGMGLAICRQIILAHSGNIALTTSKLGGATFDISLPIVTSIEDA